MDRRKFFHKLLDLSPLDIWRIIVRPQMIPVRLMSPAPVSSVDGVLLLFPNLTRKKVEDCRLEFLSDNIFFNEVNQKMIQKRNRHANWREWYEFFYMVVRFSKPRIIVETGVFDGQSSSVILLALKYNDDNGKLISIDLPANKAIEGSTVKMVESELPSNCKPGWVIPDYLRDNHRLIFGDAKELLPRLLSEEYPQIDIFFHDSLHTFEHQCFEYSTAWPCLRESGIMLSDDIFWSSAFHKFCKEKNKRYIRMKTSGFGAVKK
jgi:predicted O-methyltransferase YrrM